MISNGPFLISSSSMSSPPPPSASSSLLTTSSSHGSASFVGEGTVSSSAPSFHLSSQVSTPPAKKGDTIDLKTSQSSSSLKTTDPSSSSPLPSPALGKPFDRSLFRSFLCAASRLFCNDDQIVIVDFLALQERAFTEKDLIERLGWPDKRVREACAALVRMMILVKDQVHPGKGEKGGGDQGGGGGGRSSENKSGSTSNGGAGSESTSSSSTGGGGSTSSQYGFSSSFSPSLASSSQQYYFRISPFCLLAFHFRLQRVEQQVEEKRLAAETRDVFYCPICRTQYDAMEAQLLDIDPRDAHFLCKFCNEKLEHEDSKTLVQHASSLQQRCQAQLQTIRTLVRRGWNMQVPTFPVCTRPEKSLHRKGGEGGGDGSLVGKTHSTTSAGGGRSSSSFSDCGSPGSGITVDEEGSARSRIRLQMSSSNNKTGGSHSGSSSTGSLSSWLSQSSHLNGSSLATAVKRTSRYSSSGHSDLKRHLSAGGSTEGEKLSGLSSGSSDCSGAGSNVTSSILGGGGRHSSRGSSLVSSPAGQQPIKSRISSKQGGKEALSSDRSSDIMSSTTTPTGGVAGGGRNQIRFSMKSSAGSSSAGGGSKSSSSSTVSTSKKGSSLSSKHRTGKGFKQHTSGKQDLLEKARVRTAGRGEQEEREERGDGCRGSQVKTGGSGRGGEGQGEGRDKSRDTSAGVNTPETTTPVRNHIQNTRSANDGGESKSSASSRFTAGYSMSGDVNDDVTQQDPVTYRSASSIMMEGQSAQQAYGIDEGRRIEGEGEEIFTGGGGGEEDMFSGQAEGGENEEREGERTNSTGNPARESPPLFYVKNLGREMTLEEASNYQLDMTAEEHQKFLELQALYLDDIF
ncbi:general transcription factor iie polypeptide 1 gtf2e1 [Cystoisospora suis]|uniref:General transcription factor iie polypeptide 1 gtf2e1 n=1 Tax=Cystoisospora suis TaxID=483139 RepID=A0A2C6LBF5_9APIC|nr:general transcription factor iie polypeptide 1 gtf2e1 [Cystoisospora suis]